MTFLGMDTADFMPHGHCVLWQEAILFPMVASDVIIFLSYSLIPFALYYFYKKREDLTVEVKRVLLLFVLFIQFCGFSHLITAYNYWHAQYHWELLIKVATALVSAATAYVVLKNVKKLLNIPSPTQYRLANERLQELNENLEQEVKRQTKEIREEKLLLESIFNAIDDGLMEFIPLYEGEEIIDFRARALNDKFSFHTGISKEQLEVPSMNAARPSYRDNGRFDILMEVLKSGEPKTFNPSPIMVNNRILRATYAKNHKDNSVLLFINNITESENLKTQFMVDSRLSALGELAGGVAHEINTPLQIISGSARKIARKLSKGEYEEAGHLENLDIIQQTVKNISKIIKNLKRLSHKSSEENQKIEVISFLENTKDFIQVTLKNNNIELKESYLDRANFTLIASEVALSQIIINLINNACDELVENLTENRWIEIDIFEDHHQKVIMVRDSGRGIPEENIDKIFTPLFTTKEVGKGTGLGLSLSSKLAQSMNAYIDLDQSSETTFKIIFPKKNESQEVSQ